jgi:hypothetical protein
MQIIITCGFQAIERAVYGKNLSKGEIFDSDFREMLAPQNNNLYKLLLYFRFGTFLVSFLRFGDIKTYLKRNYTKNVTFYLPRPFHFLSYQSNRLLRRSDLHSKNF